MVLRRLAFYEGRWQIRTSQDMLGQTNHNQPPYLQGSNKVERLDMILGPPDRKVLGGMQQVHGQLAKKDHELRGIEIGVYRTFMESTD